MVIYDFDTKSFPWEYVLFGIICLILVAIAIFMLLFSIITPRNQNKLLPSKVALSICGFLIASAILFFISDYTFNQINSLRFMKNGIDTGNYEIIEGKIEHCESIYNRPSIFYDPPTDYSFSVNGKWFYTDNGKRKGKCFFRSIKKNTLK